MDVVVLDENRNLSLWEDYVVSHPKGSNYHQIGWETVIERSFGHQGPVLSGNGWRSGGWDPSLGHFEK